jgi:DNA helicase II / ATP-dependent DNA helicase PcrA
MNTVNGSFNDFFNYSLNPEQQKVVAPKEGVLLVCAGAGSGKTRVITARMAHLILNHDVQPHEVLALTFTNKAAREMKERIQRFLGEDTRLPYVGTFHSFCLKLLKSNPHLLPIGIFSLLDESDQEKLIRTILNKHGFTKRIAPKQVISFISRVKNEAVTQAEREELYSYDRILKELYFAYEHHKTAAHCLDFDDLLTHTLQLFEKHPTFKAGFHHQIRHILVDEYQDTNKVQHALLKAMAQDSQENFVLDSLCVVGDEDQSIYSWRGATVSNIINFNKDFPATTSITIEQNYRSVQPILHTANEVIKNNAYRNPKKLWSDREAHDRIRLLTCTSGYQEGEALALLVKQLQISYPHHTHAILYRSHFLSRALEEALIRQGVPYRIVGGVQFYDRLEIKDLLAYLRLIVNPFDRMAFSRIINSPSRGLGDKFEELFYQTWDEQPFLSWLDVAEVLIADQKITKSKQEALRNFIDVFERLSSTSKTSDAVNTIIQKTSYYNHLREAFEKEEAETKKENIKELLNGILFFEETTGQNLEKFLEEVALLQEHMNAKQDKHEQVRLMTLHAAKGLEFDTVMLTGIEEGVLPSAHALYQPENLEEERRLLYVGITRARERLLLSHTRYRYTYGQMTDQRPSRFLDELPELYIQHDDCSYWNAQELAHYFYTWITHPKKVQMAETPTQAATEIAQDQEWKINQLVTHKSFGDGTIQKVEKKSETTYITARFKAGIKKVDARFVQNL